VTASASELTEKVMRAVDDQRDELITAVSRAVQVPSVNPRYPGQVYEDMKAPPSSQAFPRSTTHRG
jgi:acetylornithine deacetylase